MQLQPHGDGAASVVTEILSSYLQLSQLPSLHPSSEVNGLFERLVQLCCYTPDEVMTKKVSKPT